MAEIVRRRCHNCHAVLTGADIVKCPECGAPVPARSDEHELAAGEDRPIVASREAVPVEARLTTEDIPRLTARGAQPTPAPTEVSRPAIRTHPHLAIYPQAETPVCLSLASRWIVAQRGRGSLRVVLSSVGVRKEVQYDLECTGSSVGTAYRQEGRLAVGESVEPAPVQLDIPDAQRYLLRFALQVHDADGLPRGRWTANTALQVEQSPKGDLCVVEGDLLAGADNQLPADGVADWKLARLVRDRQFDQFIKRTCPEASYNVPTYHGHNAAHSLHPAHGLIVLSTKGREERLAVQVGDHGIFGRGGVSDVPVNFPLGPVPFDEKQFGRMSRAHAQVEFASNRAWVRPLGTNFTSINGVKLPNNKRHILADGDALSIAGVVEFTVRLWAIKGHVVGVRFFRKDALEEKLSYLLALPGHAIPWVAEAKESPFAEPALWIGMASEPGGQATPSLLVPQQGNWKALGPASPQITLEKITARWKPMTLGSSTGGGTPRDQQNYLGG